MSTESRHAARAARQPADELLTIEEVAEWLKVPVATLRKWRVEGKGPAGFRIGKYVRYRRSTVETFIGQQEEAEWR